MDLSGGQLCHRCNVFQQETWQESKEVKLHDSFHDLEVSAAQGCHFCRLVRQAIYLNFPDVLSRIQDGDNDLDEKPATSEAPVNIEPVKSSAADASLASEARGQWDCFRAFIPGQRMPDGRLFRRVMVAPLPCSAADMEMTLDMQEVYQHMSDFVQPPPTPLDALSQVKEWLGHCSSRHIDMCLKSAKMERENPTRLLDLGTAPTHDIKIVALNGSYWRKYCALSYCWGPNSTCYVTTAEVLAQNMEQVPFNQLPAVFQDAIIVTRALGVRYLWIDALCIIQGDQQDWESESVKMAAVYHNAFCTVAATISRRVHQSFLGPRDAYLYPIEKCRLSGFVFHQPFIDVGTAVDEAPMNRRAWCFQERILSRRVIHFSAHGVFWECLETFGAECFLSGSKSLHEAQRTLLKSEQSKLAIALNFLSREDLRRRTDMIPVVQRIWKSLVEQVSKCGLTKEQDRLPAMSGLARLMSELTDGEYVAGMWSHTLSTDLQWCVAGRTTHMNETYVGPSWSWISTKGGVRYADEEWDHNVTPNDHEADWKLTWKITGALCSPHGSSSFGAIKAGELRVRSLVESRRAICTILVNGPLLLTEYPNRLANLEHHREFDLFASTDRSNWPDFLNFLPANIEGSNRTYLRYLVLADHDDVGPLYSISTSNTVIPVMLEKQPFDSVTDCTFLEIKRRPSVRHPGTWDVHALVLETVDPDLCIYKRVGYAKFQSAARVNGRGLNPDNPQQRPFFSSRRLVELRII